MKHQRHRIECRSLVGVALLIAGLLVPTLSAQEQASGQPLALIEAMELAVKADPSIQLAEQARTMSLGLVQQNTGAFDTSLGFQLSFDSARSLLNEAQLLAEAQKRDIFRQLSNNLDAVADALQEQLGGTDFVWADCPEGLDIVIGDQRVCISGRQRANYQLWHDLAEGGNSSDLAAALVLANRREAANAVDVLHLTAYTQRMNLRNMGTMPTVTETLTTAFDLRLTKMFRNGIVLQPGLMLDAVQDNYVGKSQQPGYGGKGIPDSVRSVLGVTLDIPLGKGRGAVSTGAAETAARHSADAALADEAFAVSSSVERTTLAYWNLATAQALLDLMRESEDLELKLLEMVEALVEADEYPAADLHFVRGRVALTRGRVASAQEEVVRARMALADAMGQKLTAIDQAPTAADALPLVPASGTDHRLVADAQVSAALLRRHDVAAARHRVEAAKKLAEAAAFDLKRRVDLQVAFGYQGLHEGGNVTAFGDLLDGWWHAVSSFSAGPSFRVALDFELPFGNRVAEGRSEQSFALDQKSRIEARDLERNVSNSVHQLSDALQQAIDEGRRRTLSVEHFREALASDIELLKAGEGSAIDVVLTQEQQVNEEVSLMLVRHAIAVLATQLSFETGSLVNCRIEADSVTVEGFNPPDASAGTMS